MPPKVRLSKSHGSGINPCRDVEPAVVQGGAIEGHDSGTNSRPMVVGARWRAMLFWMKQKQEHRPPAGSYKNGDFEASRRRQPCHTGSSGVIERIYS
ncbi:hypothetical protein SAMN05192579_10654 [Rhodanobacter glycinis]|uniref:Uncharacterized protein n=1 Tax=Rhodanobacter glycinis TaxID=582702 RepID=A0A1I4C3F4_9GAMM|nr:hypothetical protein SAMN05192579_10654 [Rhodanobacter glycinis]